MLALVLSAVFLASAVAKLLDPWQLRLTVRELLPSCPRSVTHAVALAVMGLEVVVPVLFMSGLWGLGLAGAAGTAVLATAFCAAFLLSRRLPYAVRCGCFGLLKTTTLSGWSVAVSLVVLASALAWTQATGPVATFGSFSVRLLALIAAIPVLIAHQVPRWTGARP